MGPTILLYSVFVVVHSPAAILTNSIEENLVPGDRDNPLLLTPFLQENMIKEAREAAKVNLTEFQNILSYSGYFTVDQAFNSNIFFWFFPSMGDIAKDPVILWLQGGPGSSGLFGLFVEHGPFIIENDTAYLRNTSWNKNHSVIYVDQPVGTGFSFTDGELLSDQTQIGEQIYEFLIQFFTLFPELQKNEFYLAGESYAGKYIPAAAYTMHQNKEINLQGLFIASGFSDPPHQAKFGNLLYQLGFIDINELMDFHILETDFSNYIAEEKYENATYKYLELLGTLMNYTGISNKYNFLKDVDDTSDNWQKFVNQSHVKKAIHVDLNHTFIYANTTIIDALFDDLSKTVAPWISELLSNYKIIMVNGQLDLLVPYVFTENYLQNLNFSAADEYKKAKKYIWRSNGKVGGYIKKAGNLTEVLLREAGHMIPQDQPELTYELLFKFIRNIPIGIEY